MIHLEAPMRRLACAVALAGGLILAACVPPPGPAAIVSSGPGHQKAVALTFDGHFDAQFTPAILDLLKKAEIPATFFVTGQWAEQHPAWLRRIVAEGHVLGNHSYSHRSFTKLSDAAVVDELVRTDAAISKIAGVSTKPLFRPPFGAQSARVNRLLGAQGYRYDVLWTIDSLGWKGLSPGEIISRCLDRAAPGGILLFHLSSPNDFQALPWVIVALAFRGYRFVALDAWFR
jgi:peptidoglycan/xylan/chitin deacetylase (PgdA/CDA1 family)